MTPTEINEQFAELIRSGEMAWEPVDRDTLDSSTLWYIGHFEDAGLDCKVGSTRIGTAVVIATGWDQVPFFEHHPDLRVHAWLDLFYEEFLDNNRCLAHVMTREFPELDLEVVVKLFDAVDLGEGPDLDDQSPTHDEW